MSDELASAVDSATMSSLGVLVGTSLPVYEVLLLLLVMQRGVCSNARDTVYARFCLCAHNKMEAALPAEGVDKVASKYVTSMLCMIKK